MVRDYAKDVETSQLLHGGDILNKAFLVYFQKCSSS